MRKISLTIFLTTLALVFVFSVAVQAANDDFTASGDVTVELTGGNVTILSGSTAESVIITDGVLTVSNPGSTSTPLFQLQPAGGGTVSIKATIGGADAGCSGSTLILPTTPGTYTIVAQNGQCGGSGGAGSGGGGGGGGTTTPPPTTPTPTTTPTTTPQTSPASIGALGSAVKSIFTTLNTLTKFTTPLSKEATDLNHSIKVSSLDTVNKKMQVILQSDPVTVDLALGETKKVDLDKDGVYDLSVKFNNLIGETIDLTLANIVILEKTGLHVGDLIKTAKDSAVYYVDASGRRNLFVNGVTFWTWYTGSWSSIAYKGQAKTIKIMSQTDFDGLAMGAHITVNPGAKLIKFQNSPRVYTITLGKVLREVVKSGGDDAVAKALYGSTYKSKIITIQNGFEGDYTRGEALTVSSPVPTATAEIESTVN
ncbi:MAG: hypothetical protein Q7K65_03990 [Candidatus Buchananbacteria bacterium]|nr:hypothetical protein [Candidatus Buchananbacteria bacterium]